MNRDPRTRPVLLFLHVPKTGGTTLRDVIYEQYRTPDYYEAEEGYLAAGIYYSPVGLINDWKWPTWDNVSHALRRDDVAAVVGHFSYGIHALLPGSIRYVTLLRDPVDRTVSLYNHLTKYYPIPEISLQEFVCNPSVLGRLGDRAALVLDNDQTRRLAGVQVPFGRCSAETLEIAKQNLRCKFSVVGTTERFDESLLLMQRRLKWSPRIYHARLNVNAQRKRVQEIDDDLASLIADRNRHDVALHAFADALLDEAIAAEPARLTIAIDAFGRANAEFQRAALEADLAGRGGGVPAFVEALLDEDREMEPAIPAAQINGFRRANAAYELALRRLDVDEES